MLRGPIEFDLLKGMQPDALLQSLCRQYEVAWRSGQAPSIESVLMQLQSASPSRIVTSLVELEFRLRTETGEQPRVEEYLNRFPRFATELGDRLSFILDPPEQLVGSTVQLADSVYGRRLAARTNLQKTGIGRYRVDGLIGTGASGEVWKGYDSHLDRPVAIKLLRADRCFSRDAEASFLDEGRKLAQLRHPGIVSVYDLGNLEGNYYLVSEFVGGGTLDERIKQSPIPFADSIRMMAEIAEALHYAHLRGIVHRDVKPQNILLGSDGAARLADFGMAATEEQQLCEGASVRGTLSYMSPEQMRGDSHMADPRSDIYSVGAVLYLLMSGRLPFLAQSLSQLREQALNREPRPLRTINDKLPPEVEQICLKCLRLNPGDRYTTALDLAKDLRAILNPAPVRTFRWWVAAAAASVVFIMLLWGVTGNRPRGEVGGQKSSTDEISQGLMTPPVDWNEVGSDNLLKVATVSAAGRGHFRTITDALKAIGPHGIIRIVDDATYRENLAINLPSQYQGLTIESTAGATLTSSSTAHPIIEIRGVHGVTIRNLKILIANSEHAVMVCDGSEGAHLESLRITQPAAWATAAVQIFGGNPHEDADELVISNCDIESHLTGQSLWVHADPTPVCNLVVRRNQFRSKGKGSLVVFQGCLKNSVVDDNLFEGGYTGLNINASSSDGPFVKITDNRFHRCDNWLGLMSTRPALVEIELTNNLVFNCAAVEITSQQLSEVSTAWVLGGNYWERVPKGVAPHSSLNQLAQFLEQIPVKSRNRGEPDYLKPVDPPPRFQEKPKNVQP